MPSPPPIAATPDPTAIDRLVLRAQSGDSAAFDRLVLDLHRPVRMAIAAYAHNADQIEEILQAAWVTAYEQLARYEPRGTFLPWVKAIARNLLREDLRERLRVRRAGGGDVLEGLLATAALDDLDGDESTGRSANLLARLAPCLAALAPRSRDLLLARDRDGEALPSLARRYKQTKDVLATALWRIRRSVRRCVEASA
jgi:RNA polymerase sigma-70 factor (ECF subfamily)